MFLLPHQTSTSTSTPFMAQITGDSPSNPILVGFPFSDSSQTDRNFCLNHSSSQDPGLGNIFNQVVEKRNSAELQPKSRKRGREGQDSSLHSASKDTKISTTCLYSSSSVPQVSQIGCFSSSSTCNGDIYLKMLTEQQEVDILILMHMEKLRVELEQKRRHYWTHLLQTVEERLQRIINEKDEEIAKISRRNTALEEKVKILVMEGQIWKTLAQTNEATAMSLRRDLEVAQAREGEGECGEVSDSLSCYHEEKIHGGRSCQNCRKNETSVLLLPCRHLCLCSECDPLVKSCPSCLSPKSGSIKVYLS